jgi:putative two-component system response regulator
MTEYDRGSGYILIVDDAPANLEILVGTLKDRGHQVRPVLDGGLALEVARREPPTLILLDINMPGMNGYEVCAEFKKDTRLADIPIIFLSANTDTSNKVHAFSSGGVDYITKPFQTEEVNARVETHLKIRRLQVELDRYNHSLQDMVQAQVKEISESQIATILALAKLAEFRDEDTGNHILRVQRYCRVLAKRLAGEGVFGTLLDDSFIENFFYASALHDIGKVGIPDSILLKPGGLSAEEFDTMKSHAALGAEALAVVLEIYPRNEFVRLGMETARSHHEHWDGSGYPDGLSGEAIPLGARILALADKYDALRNKRPYKPAFDAAKAFAILTEGDDRSDPRHLDPRVLAAFTAIAGDFDAIFEELREPIAQ